MQFILRFILLPGFILALCSNGNALQNTDNHIVIKHRIDSLLFSYQYYKRFAGTILVAKGNDILTIKSYGLADATAGTENKDTSIYNLASCSKQFTATAILKLEEQGLLTISL
jgi:CubicO group peptidase (beta-lactamase class C family)